MTTICFLLTYIFEQFVAYIYFSKKLTQKVSNKQLLSSYIISFAIQFAVNFTNIPYLNLLSFLICNFLIAYICYYSSIKQVIFNVLLLESLMIVTELIIIYSATLLFKIDLKDYSTNPYIFTLETIGTKTLYFVFAYISSRISFKEKKNAINKDYSYLLFFLPLTSVILIMSLVYVSINLDLDQIANILFMIISFLLLIINIVVFLVHERIISTLTKNTELQLEKQKEEINQEYYIELERQYDASNILVHDIKRCLLNIRELSNSKDYTEIIKYVDSIYQGYEIKSLKQYSNNKLVNVIVNRYAQLCYENNIEFCADIRNIDFSFISDSDLTSLLDNLLENSYEASRNSQDKLINLNIDIKNESYVRIDISNSCDKNPIKTNKYFETSKKDKKSHGFGLKIINKIIKKYNGNFEYSYDIDLHVFNISIILKTQKFLISA